MADQMIRVERTDGVLVITMDDPPTRNSLGADMTAQIREELDRFEQDPDDRVLLLTGADPAFCSGANVRRMDREAQQRSGEPPAEKAELPWGKMEKRFGSRAESDEAWRVGNFPLRIHNLQKPSIAAVNGYAMGVGMGISLACDIRLASENAIFSEAFVLRGLIPGDGSCWQLPRLIGLSNTLLIQYTGDRIDGNEAYRLGLASKVYPHDELMPAAIELAARLANGPTQAMSLIKYLVRKSMDVSLEESLEMGHAAQDIARGTDDHKEAVRAFVEKRKPAFKGR